MIQMIPFAHLIFPQSSSTLSTLSSPSSYWLP